MVPELGSKDVATITDTVEEVAGLRIGRLKLANLYPTTPAQDLAGGRLLFYAPFENLAEGSEEDETNSFFDVNAVPPWDTWLWFVSHNTIEKRRQGEDFRYQWWDEYMISWVPPELVDIVDVGASTSTTNALIWADKADSDFLDQLRVANIPT